MAEARACGRITKGRDRGRDKAAARNKKNGGITFTRHAEWQRESVILNQADVLLWVGSVREGGKKAQLTKYT